METQFDTRKGKRLTVSMCAFARIAADQPVPITLENLSISGFRAVIPFDLRKDMLFRVRLPGGSSPLARVVRLEEHVAGCAFEVAIEEDEVQAIRRIFETTSAFSLV